MERREGNEMEEQKEVKRRDIIISEKHTPGDVLLLCSADTCIPLGPFQQASTPALFPFRTTSCGMDRLAAATSHVLGVPLISSQGCLLQIQPSEQN